MAKAWLTPWSRSRWAVSRTPAAIDRRLGRRGLHLHAAFGSELLEIVRHLILELAQDVKIRPCARGRRRREVLT